MASPTAQAVDLTTTSAPSAWFTQPPASFFKFPPANDPVVLSPPVKEYSLARPFNIDPALYNALLDFRIPVTIAVTYAVTAYTLNVINRRSGHKPWPFAKTSLFYILVLAHNIFLTLYSAWTFIGMVNAIGRSWPDYQETGLVGVVDALCKMNGPRGLGDAAIYDSTTSTWGYKNAAIKLLNGQPDNTDVGRLWNEGLAFYGWLFYLSKFYEVVDTLIILAKGKSSSVLQTYHHAGAMLCMWAGIRYMSPPIWMFVAFNSLIHTLMYFYYTLSALNIRVPMIIKRSLTTLQISQFLIGSVFAGLHLIIGYSFDVSAPFTVLQKISSIAPSITSDLAAAATSAGIGNWLKKIALRAAGEEGLAENVRNQYGSRFGMDSAIDTQEVQRQWEETQYKIVHSEVHCLDTSGQAFAIYLNVMYLAPLTVLFVRFFMRSYLNRTDKATKHRTYSNTIEKSAIDALRGVEREIHEAMGGKQGETEIPPELKKKLHDAKQKAKAQSQKAGQKLNKYNSDPKVEFQKDLENVKKGAIKAQAQGEKGMEKASEVASDLKESTKPVIDKASEKAGELTDSANVKIAEATDAVKSAAAEAQKQAEPVVEQTKEEGPWFNKKSSKKAKQAAKEAESSAKIVGGQSYAAAVVEGKDPDA